VLSPHAFWKNPEGKLVPRIPSNSVIHKTDAVPPRGRNRANRATCHRTPVHTRTPPNNELLLQPPVRQAIEAEWTLQASGPAAQCFSHFLSAFFYVVNYGARRLRERRGQCSRSRTTRQCLCTLVSHLNWREQRAVACICRRSSFHLYAVKHPTKDVSILCPRSASLADAGHSSQSVTLVVTWLQLVALNQNGLPQCGMHNSTNRQGPRPSTPVQQRVVSSSPMATPGEHMEC